MNPYEVQRIQIDPAVAARKVAELCAFADVEMKDEWTREEVANLLHACGYAVTLGTVGEMIRKNYVGEPDDDRWEPGHIFALAMSLESRRRWLPMPNLAHDGKKSAARQAIEMARLSGAVEIDDLDQFSLEDLLIRMAETSNLQLREGYHEGIRAKLEDLGFIEE